MRAATTTAAFSMLAVLTGVTIFGRTASGAEPTTLECLAAHEDSVKLRKNQKLRAAREKLVTCSSESCPAEIRTECIGRVPVVDASMATVVFEVKDAVGKNLVAVTVTIDGDLLADRLPGSALSIDPGEHTFTFAVAGHPSIEKRLLILEGEKLRRERVEFETAAAPKPVATTPVAPAKSEVLQPSQPVEVAQPAFGKSRTLGLVLGGVGVAAIGVGVAYGLVAKSRRDEANAVCPNQCLNRNGVDLWNRAGSAGNISTGAFVIGAAAIASAVVVLVRAKPAADGAVDPQISLGPGGFQVIGRW